MEFKVEMVHERIEKGEELEKILKKEKWQSFEKFVAWIFEIHGYDTQLHLRLKSKREIDVLAEKEAIAFAVECKKWSGKSQYVARLKEVARIHKEKCKELENMKERRIIPIVVTLLESGILEIDDVIFIPIFKLNNFLRAEMYFLKY